MQTYNFPTVIYFGEGALSQLAEKIKQGGLKKVFLVTDKTLVELGLAQQVVDKFTAQSIETAIFSDTHPNPIEEDVTKGVAAYKKNNCDCLVALGGGSPIDAAKTIKFMVTHEAPLAQYDDALGGDKLIVNKMPAFFAIPTTAGTGSEVGRSSVIMLKETGAKTIFFHPDLMPDVAVLAPELTTGLPPHLTAATGVDALTHSVEAYFAPGFHPMADGIAKEAMSLVLKHLPIACRDGKNLDAREKMLIASAMGATAFQKGLGAVHSLAHPLSSEYGMHHGLANALLLPTGIAFLEAAKLNQEQKDRIAYLGTLLNEAGFKGDSVSAACKNFIESLGIKFGLKDYKIPEDGLEKLSEKAFADPCHPTNMIPVTQADLLAVYRSAF